MSDQHEYHQSKRRTLTTEEFDVRGRRSFLTGLVAMGLGGASVAYLSGQTAPNDNIAAPLRSVHDFNSAPPWGP